MKSLAPIWLVFEVCLLLPFIGCTTAGKESSSASFADMIFLNGEIVTVNDKQPSAEALAVKDGKILLVGDDADVLKSKGPGTQVIDLDGKALLPGFLDGHSHFINSIALSGQANCYAAPFGPGSTRQGIVDSLKKLQAEKKFSRGEPIFGYGYDDSIFPEGGKLTAADLDRDFPDNPVYVQHVSLHGAVLNSVALKKHDVTAATQTPPGGIIVRKPGSQEPEGLLMETAYLPIFQSLPKPAPEEMPRLIREGQMIYAAAGVTTAHEGSTMRGDVEILSEAAKRGDLFIDVIAYPFITELDAVLQKHPVDSFCRYNNRLKLGGIKITIDGSPQGRTAHFTTPYLTGGPSGEKDWRGEPTFPVPMFRQFVKRVHDLHLPLIMHGNGDAAIDNILAAHELALGDKVSTDHRTGIIHCQFVRKDQLDKIAKYRIIPSFYTEHTYFFARTHIANRGIEQASFLSPLKSAGARGIIYSNHTDFNVAPIDQLFVIWSAVNREMREGGVLGADERVAPLDALKAITINAAYWYREEDRKGSLEAGKLADMVVLSANPLTVDPMQIKDIRVLETIKEGKSIYKAE